MKKIIYLILGVLLFIPSLVKADMSAPGIIPYKATPKSTSGADIYQYDADKDDYVKTGKKLEYGKTIIVNWEDEYVSTDIDNDDNEDVVKLTDLVPLEKNYNVNEKELSNPVEVFVLKKQEIKKGPAKTYESTGKSIPAGTKIKVKYFDPDSKGNPSFSGDSTAWVYVEYNGTKGFIDTENSIATNPVYTTVIASTDIKVYKPGTETQIATIKANTKFNATVYETDVWTSGYYIEYENIKGVVSDEDHFYPKRKAITFKPTEKIKIYESLKYNDDGEITSKVVTTISKGTSFKSEYYFMYNDFIYVYYENANVKGWIEETGRDTDPDSEDSEYLSVTDILGFTEPTDDSIIKVEKKEEQTNEKEESSPVEINPEKTTSTNEENKNKDTKNPAKKIPVLVYYCVGCAIIISLTATVTALLINKKNKRKEEYITYENK